MRYCSINSKYCEDATDNGYCSRSACRNLDLLANTTQKKQQTNWHTGIPTKKGRYVCLVRDKGCILDKYVILEWHDDSIEWGGWFRPEHKGEYEVLGWIFIGDCPYGQIESPLNKLKASNEEKNK